MITKTSFVTSYPHHILLKKNVFITSFSSTPCPSPIGKHPAFCFTNQHHQVQLATYCLLYIRLPKSPIHYTFTLKMANAVFAKTLDNSQHLMQLNTKSQSYTLNYSSKNLRTRNRLSGNFYVLTKH
jgi:hypothetical protein